MTVRAFEPWERELLQTSPVARLATVASDGRPHLVPVCYALVGERIAIAVDEKPKSGTNLARLRNIDRDSRVSLLIDRYDEDWAKLAWLRIDGEANVEPTGSLNPAALAALRMRYKPYGAMDLEGRPLIMVRPTRVASWRWAG